MSRLTNAREAVRPALKARMMLSGPAGSGKTRSALIVGTVLAEDEPILVIDTERESALTYADDFAFKHLIWEPPYNPQELGQTLLEAGDSYGVIIVDSASHFWRGDGGTLDIADGKFTGWKAARPAQADLIDAILQTRSHVIICSRSKVEHVQELEGGRHVVKKLGMAVIQDDTLEYELNIAVELGMDHQMSVSKSRTVAVPVGRTFKAGHAEDFATIYGAWLKGGEPPAAQTVVDDLIARMNALTNGRKVACKQEFMATFGRPDHLRESQVADAVALVTKWEDTPPIDTPPDGGGMDSGPDDPGVAGGEDRESQQPEPNSLNLGSEREPETGADAEEVPAASAPPSDDIVYRDIDLLKLCSEVFKPVREAAPHGQKGKVEERLRYAITWAVTKGRATSLKELTAQEKHLLWMELSWLKDGFNTWEATDDALVITHVSDGREVVIAYTDIEETTAA